MPEFIYVSQTHGVTAAGDVYYYRQKGWQYPIVRALDKRSWEKIKAGYFASMEWWPVEPVSLENE